MFLSLDGHVIWESVHSQAPERAQDAFKEHSNRAGAQEMLRPSPALNGKEEDMYLASLGGRSWAGMEIQVRLQKDFSAVLQQSPLGRK